MVKISELLSLSKEAPKRHALYSTAAMEEPIPIILDKRLSPDVLEDAMKTWAIIFRAINQRADLIIANGFKIVSESDKARESVLKFIKRINNGQAQGSAFLNLIRGWIIDTDVFGNGYLELQYNSGKNDIIGLSPIHPKTIDFKRDRGKIILDQSGMPVSYEQDVNGKKKDIPIEKVAHLKFNVLGDEFLGYSTIEPMYQQLLWLANIQEGIATATKRAGWPLHDITVGTADDPATQKDLDEAEKAAKNLNAASSYVHSHLFKTKIVESSITKNFVNYPDPFVNMIVAATGIPRFILLGIGEGTNRATAQVLSKHLRPMIQSLQMKTKLEVERQIFRRYLELQGIEDMAYIEWNEALPEEAESVARRLNVLSKTVFTEQSVISKEEAREMLGLITERSPASHSMEELESIPGIYLVSPHSKLIYAGRKKAVVKAKEFDKYVGKRLYWMDKDYVYGILRLMKPNKIDLNDFERLYKFHLVTDEEREKWWPGHDTLYYYQIRVETRFDKPKRWRYQKGVQTFVNKVTFI
jgi:hypothetical protein